AVLTGGGSFLAGIATLASEELDMEARTGAAQGVGGLAEVVTNPSFATGIGLLRLGGGAGWGANARLPHRSRNSRAGWLKRWLEDLF
ncbi:MAG: cell division protein FtsA, partial [bacterium]